MRAALAQCEDHSRYCRFRVADERLSCHQWAMLAQTSLIILLTVMVAAFASGRVRVEVVALLGLAAAFVLGLVPEAEVFSGFASATVMTVLEILLIIGVINRSHVLDALARVWPAQFAPRATVFALLLLSATISVFMNNIGALALVIPLVLAVGARHGLPAASLLMSVSFATLLGGLGSVIGTPANLLVAHAVEQVRSVPFGFFEIGLVGIPIAAVGLVYLSLAIPVWSTPERTLDTGATGQDRHIAVQLVVPPDSRLIGLDASALGDLDLDVVDLILVGQIRSAEDHLRAGDMVFIRVGQAPLEDLMRDGLLAPLPALDGDAVQVDAVVMPDSIFVGSQIADLEPLHARDIMVDGLRVSGRTVEGAFAEQRLRIGDVLLLRGNAAALAAELEECGLMVLAQPKGQKDTTASLLPILIFASGIGLTAIGGLSPELAFGLVVLALALTGSLSIRRGLETMNWPILIMLGAMIPIGAAVETTGLATSLVAVATGLLPVANLPTLIAAMVVLAALLTPFVNNPATFLMLAPIAVETAGQYGVPAEPLILAIGVGASLDFLTPFGHHNNTLVMGLGGYSFADFLRLGAPLLLLTAGTTILVLSWRFG